MPFPERKWDKGERASKAIYVAEMPRESLSLTDIAGMVAAMTEGDPGVESERTSYNILG